MSNQTIIEKIITNHLQDGTTTPNSEINIKIDQTLCQDATGTMAFLELEAMQVSKVQTQLSIQYVDHNTSQIGPENHNDHLYLQTICSAKGVKYSRPGNGICHQVHLERFGIPGKTLLGSDSHTPTNGGIAMLAIGAGGLDIATAMAGKPFKMKMPKIIGIKLSNQLPPASAAKDIILTILSILTTKGNVGYAIEYFGEGVQTLTVPERATITNMGAELGVTCSIFPSDQITRQFLKAQQREHHWQPLQADSDAKYHRIIELDLATIVPMAACPSSPDNIKTIAELNNPKISQVIIGSCTNSSLKDLTMVAQILKHNKVHPDVSLAIAPGSKQVLQMLADNGSLSAMISAGARILESACGPCIGQGFSPANGEISVRTFNRNFSGRTGTTDDQVYLVSPETAIAASITSTLSDPRNLSTPFPQWQEPEQFLVDDSMILEPNPTNQQIIRKPTVGEPPHCLPYPSQIIGQIIAKFTDKITTDHIMPAGKYLKLRSNIPAYSQVVFAPFNKKNKPTFAQQALALKEKNITGIIIAGESYGQGSSREHAAICPMYLGIKVIIAKSIERIHAANLINFGILPLIFDNQSDYQLLAENNKITIKNIQQQLKPNQKITINYHKTDKINLEIQLKHTLSAKDITILLAGGRLNM